MPSKGKIPPFLVLLVLAFTFVGIAGFQIVKERRIATAALNAKEFELESFENDLKRQVKLTGKKDEERLFVLSKVAELERFTKLAQESLRAKKQELETLKKEHEKTVEDLQELKRVVDQKEGEIVHVREQLQEYSFEKAKESAEHINTLVEASDEDRQEEAKLADEAGLDDRKRIQEEEDGQATEETAATEKEMFERSQQKEEYGKATVADISDSELLEKSSESLKLDSLQDEEAEEQDIADTRDPDEKENDASQEEDLHDDTKLGVELQTGDQEEEHGAV